MDKKTMIIAIFLALVMLWVAETLHMRKTTKLLSGAIDIGFHVLR